MGKQLIERIAPLVQAALEQDYLFPAQGGRKSLSEAITALVIARIDAELGKDAVAWLDPWTGNNVTTDRDAYGDRGTPLFLSPTPTIPEGMALVPIEPTKAMLIEGRQADTDWMNSDDPEEEFEQGLAYIYKAMLAAQGERNAD